MSTSTLVDSTWTRVGTVPPTSLVDARLQIHHATQIVVSAAISYLPARPDDSHTALTWSSASRALLSEPITTTTPLRIGLRIEDLTLLRFDEALLPTDAFALGGRTIADGHDWLRQIAANAGLDSARLDSRKHYTIPDHPVATGAAFSHGSGAEFAELAIYWANAAAVVERVARATRGASDVRTWPHHFDLATLIAIPGGNKTIGVGHSPGDDSFAEPYWYVGPSPRPNATSLPPLPVGRWHTTGWFGTAFPASAYVADADQSGTVATFVDASVAACRTLG